MDEPSIFEIAEYCHNRLKKINENYITCYCAIFKDNSVLCSYTPHVLLKEGVEQALLIHTGEPESFIEIIDPDGCVHKENLGNGFSIEYWNLYDIGIRAYNYNGKRANYYIYRCSASSFEEVVPKIWEVYCHLRDMDSDEEMDNYVESYEKQSK